jgi:hypothetical protein
VPNVGPVAGGISVVVNGNGFTGATAVNFGTAKDTTFTVNSDNQITVPSIPAAPGGVPATVDVTVVTPGTALLPGGTSPPVAADDFTYLAAPTITTDGIVPDDGPVAGGTAVTITGTGFISGDPKLAVDFGANAATDVTVVSSTEITADSPPSTLAGNGAGAVNVVVKDSGGTSNAQPFTYVAAPTILPPDQNGIVPDSGPTSGGTNVTITGTNFVSGASVQFGGSMGPLATNVVVVSTTEITATTPPGDAGTVNVTVTDVGGTSNNEPFTYVAPPNIGVNGLDPSFGPDTGGTVITLTGTGLSGITGVTFTNAATFTGCGQGSFTAGTDLNPISDTSAQITTAASPFDGPAVVCVTATGGTAPAAEEFTFEGVPTIATTNGLSPATGPVAGGTLVTITGTNFPASDPNLVVNFGANQGTELTVVSATQITVDSPASTLSGNGAGPVNVTVEDSAGTSNSQVFTYVAVPTILPPGQNGIVPDTGPTMGGTPVVITGTGFLTGATVSFGGNAATAVVVKNSTTIDATSPASTDLAAGTVNVTVTDAGGTSNPEPFTYVGVPNVGANGLNPAFGPDTGGTVVTITGTGLTGISAVDFISTSTFSNCSTGTFTAGTNLDAVSDTEAKITTPAFADGPATVCITAAGGTAAATEHFTFEGTPVINANGINPNQGPTAGGTPVTITGSNFPAGDPNVTVTFGGNDATQVNVEDATTILAITPASTLPGNGAGPVPVVVSDLGGTSNQDLTFTYIVAPTVAGISPTSGQPNGGETVIIKGADLCNATSVMFGNNSAPIQNITPDCTTIDVTSPPGQGTVPVVVMTDGGSARSPENFTYIPPGYWMSASDGGVFAFGGAQFYGSMGGKPLNQPIVAMADTPDHQGYWLFAADGGVFAFGDAQFYGSVPGVLVPEHRTLNKPIVAAEATPDGNGYRMFAADGGVFDFGDALFEGSLPGESIIPPGPIASATTYPFGTTSSGDDAGYWLVDSLGNVYPFGNAPKNIGSGVGHVDDFVVTLATTPTGNGYYMFEINGQVAALGDANPNLGEVTFPLNKPVVFGQATSDGEGYWEFAADGGVFTFGDAPFEGSLGSLKLNAPINGAIGFGTTSG